MTRWLFLAAVGVCAWLIPRAGDAARYTWNTPATGNWTDPSRWTTSTIPPSQGVPGEGDMAVIGSGQGNGGAALLNAAAPNILNFDVGSQGQGQLNIVPGGSLTTTGTGDAIGLNGNGRLIVSGGQLTLGGRLDIDVAQIAQTGGTIELGSSSLGNVNLGLSGTAQWAVSGAADLDVGANLNVGQGGTGLFSQTGGQVLVREVLNIGAAGGAGEYAFAGGTLVVEEVLRLGATGDGRLFVGNSTGSILVGNMQIGARGTLAVELGANTTVIEATTATLGGQLLVTTSGPIAPGAIRPLLLVDGAAPLSTTFAGLPQGAVVFAPGASGGVPLRINYAANIDGGAAANDVTLTVLLPGDANFDRVVNRADVARLVHGFGGAGTFSTGEFNGDGIVGLADVLRLQRSVVFSGATPAAAVPEPGGISLALAAFAAAGMAANRRRRVRNGVASKRPACALA